MALGLGIALNKKNTERLREWVSPISSERPGCEKPRAILIISLVAIWPDHWRRRTRHNGGR